MSKKNHEKPRGTDWDSYWDKYRKLLITASPVFLALAILTLFGYFWNGPLPPLMLSLIFFVGGFTGVIVVVRREFPAVIFTITGVQAIVEGSLVTVLLWGAAAYIITR